jgi:hypothetical protein
MIDVVRSTQPYLLMGISLLAGVVVCVMIG